jgi:hypothetical protein
MKSRAAQAQANLTGARDALDRAIAECPDDSQTLRERCQFFFDHATFDEAEETLRALIHHIPAGGTALMRCKTCAPRNF